MESVGYLAGASRDLGMPGYAKLGCEAIDLMERDPILRDMAKKCYEDRDVFFTGRHPLYKHRSFDQLITDIRAANDLGNVFQKGIDAEATLLRAATGDLKLTKEQKTEYVKDVLRSNLVDRYYYMDLEKRTSTSHPNGLNEDVIAFDQYIEELSDKLDELGESGPGIIAVGGGSSLPTKMPSMLISGLRNRAQQKAPIIYDVGDPEWAKKMDDTLNKIVRLDGLDEMTIDEICTKVVLPAKSMSRYGQDKIVQLAALVTEPQKQQAPELREQPGKNGPEKDGSGKDDAAAGAQMNV